MVNKMAYEYKEYNFNKNIKKVVALNIRKFRKQKGFTQIMANITKGHHACDFSI